MYVCRICLDPNIAKDMSELPMQLKGEAVSFEEVIYFCLNIQVAHDPDLYRKLCAQCFDRILSFYMFKSLAMKNNNYIQSLCSNKEGLEAPPAMKIEVDFEEYEDYFVLEPEIITEPVGEDDQQNASDFCGDKVAEIPHHFLSQDSVTSSESANVVPCQSCKDVFTTRQQMLRHVKLKHPPEIQCDKCNQSVICLTHHMRQTHGEQSAVQCAHCKAGAEYLAGPHQCAQCPKSFRKEHRLDAHVQRFHVEKKKLQCQYCPEKFSAYCALHKHETTHTPTEDQTSIENKSKTDASSTNKDESGTNKDESVTDKSESGTNIYESSTKESTTGTESTEESTKKVFKCAECGEVFKNRTMMYRHRDPKGKRQCDICLKFYSYASLSTHKRLVHKKESLPFGCAHCHRRFLQQSKLKDHERTHTNERPFACTHCEKCFTQEIALKNHVQNIHEKRRPYICQHCCMGFFQKHNLETHILRRHSSEFPHQCLECGMRFKIIDALRDHSSKHTGARPHQCPHCSLTFRQRGGLRSHLRTHSSEQPYACRFCGARFKRGDYRRNHERKSHLALFNLAESGKSLFQGK